MCCDDHAANYDQAEYDADVQESNRKYNLAWASVMSASSEQEYTQVVELC